MEQYEKILETLNPGMSFGVGGIRVYRPEELRSMQIGYSVSPSGEPLTGDKSGDWLKSWGAIGHDLGIFDC